MNEPLVSIVTLTYKKFDYIYSTIDSVIEQAYSNIEYIISDDGSGNLPKKEIEDYVKKKNKGNIRKFSVLTFVHNKGTVKNVNRAYRYASGDILIPLSADDSFYSSDVVEKIVSTFVKRSCDVLVTSRMVCEKDGTEIKRIPSRTNEKYINTLDTADKQHLAFITDEFYDMASGSAMYIRKAFLEKWGYFDEKYVLWEDGPFLTQYTRKNIITTEYGIISIKYRLGGVSNGMPNPLMRKDQELYDKKDRVLELSKLSVLKKRKVEYICKRYKTSSFSHKLFLYLTYPDVMLGKIVYKLKQTGVKCKS